MSSLDSSILRWDDLKVVVSTKKWYSMQRGKKAAVTTLLHGISGHLVRGEMLAIMGPSGAGKSTLLDAISGRLTPTEGKITMMNQGSGRHKSSYVEQHDSLLGVLTVRETLYFSAKLSMPIETSKRQVDERVDAVLDGLGLRSVAGNTVGTPIKRGISGGQKRRVTIGCSLVSMPHILFLDEPTSGLDIHTAYEVMSSILRFSRQYNIAVAATIHSPNWDIFQLFSNVMLLAKGHTVYFGSPFGVTDYMEELGQPCPHLTNPADHMLRIVSDEDFGGGAVVQREKLQQSVDPDIEARAGEMANRPKVDVNELSDCWKAWEASHLQFSEPNMPIDKSKNSAHKAFASASEANVGSALQTAAIHQPRLHATHRLAFATWILTVRNMINYRRNLLAYGVRFAMYIGMGVLLATVWVNLDNSDSRINDRLSVHFFSVAFLGFMSVAGIPSFLEERAVMRRERFNGLYGPAPFTLANTFVTMPFLFACALSFALLCYWSIGLHPGAESFFRWLVFLYLGVLAAEMQSLLVAAILPVFVASLAIAAFLNGFWMTTQGYFIRTANLPRFWYYWAHFINYETYAMALLVRTDFKNIVFKCAIPGQCSFPAQATDPSLVAGETVVTALEFNKISLPGQVAILLSIVLIYRVLFYLVLKMQKG